MVLGRVVVDDDVNVLDVETPGGHVGGHQDGELGGGEVEEGLLPRRLAEVAVDGGGPDPLALELLDQAVGAPLGPDEDEDLGRPLADGGGHLDLVHLVDPEEAVLHEVDGDPGRGHFVADGVGQVAADEAVDVTVESGREEHGLVGLLDPAQHPVDLGEKAHVGHAVGLVEDSHLDVGHRDLAPVGQVDQAARGGDDDVDALVELLDLALDVGPAVEDDGPAAGGLGQWLEDLGHLDGQLPSGDEDETAGPAGGRGYPGA